MLWTRKSHLIPFLDGLINIGKPSPSLFPSELVQQALELVLSGLNNTLAIQSSLDWVWPYWVERQTDADAPEFIPTGVNLVTTNLSHRNWTSLGLERSERESMVDPVGMLTLRAFGWSAFPYVRMGNKDYFPPLMTGVRQSLKDGFLPCVVTSYRASPELSWKSETMAILADGEELVSFRHTLENLSEHPLSLIFGIAIRPYNPLTVGHINKVKFKKQLWRINGRPGLLMLDEPTAVILSDRHHGDPLFRGMGISGIKSLTSKSGIASGVAEFSVDLNPGEQREIETAGTVGKLPEHPDLKFKNITRELLASSRKTELHYWRRHAESGLQIKIPDELIETAFYAVKSHIHVFDDGDHFTPGTFLYHGHWFRDAAYLALCYQNLGLSERVKPKLLKFLEHQTSDGFFKSQTGEWDSNGQAITTIVDHVRRTADLELMRTCYPAIIRGIAWIEGMRKRTRKAHSPHYGLLPAGISAEHFGPNDHYFWDNFWSLAAVRSASWAARRLNHVKDVRFLTAAYLDYKYHLLAAIKGACKGEEPVLPCSPYRRMDSAAVGTLVAVSPLSIISPQEEWVRNTVNYLARHNLRNNLFFQEIIHTGLNPYLSAQLARAMMSLEDSRWMNVLKGLCDSASSTYTWPEAIHPGTGGGCMGDGDHGWSAAEFVNLIRDMLVKEQEGAVLLAHGVPIEWFTLGERICVKEASTGTGWITYSFEPHPRGARLAWSIRRQPEQESLPIYFFYPLGLMEGDARPVSRKRTRILLEDDEGTIDLSYASGYSARKGIGPRPLQGNEGETVH